MKTIKSDTVFNLYEKLEAITTELKSRENIREYSRSLNSIKVHPNTKSANLQRAELIQGAKWVVEGLMNRIKQGFYATGHVVDFVEDDKKNVVLALVKTNTGALSYHGIAKCMPDDVFNSDIGKAIALARALEIDIPKEFLSAVQPDEQVVGMLIRNDKQLHDVDKGRIVRIGKAGQYNTDGDICSLGSRVTRNATIIDDSNAIYGVQK